MTKKLKSFLLTLYFNWIFIALALVSFNVFVLGVTAWSFLLPFALLGLMGYASGSRENGRCIRYALWPLYHQYMRKRILPKAGPLIAYPLLIWIELEGRNSYIKGGYKGFTDDHNAHLQKVCDGMINMLGKMKPLDENPN